MEKVIAEMQEWTRLERMVDQELIEAAMRHKQCQTTARELEARIRKRCQGFEALGIEIEDWDVRQRCKKDRDDRRGERMFEAMDT